MRINPFKNAYSLGSLGILIQRGSSRSKEFVLLTNRDYHDAQPIWQTLSTSTLPFTSQKNENQTVNSL